MEQGKRVKEILRTYYRWSFLPVIMAIFMSAIIIYYNTVVGIVSMVIAAILLVMLIFLYRKSEDKISRIIYHYAVTYGFIQRNLLEDMMVPYAILSLQGKILWMNREFREIAGDKVDAEGTIFNLIPELKKDILPEEADQAVEMHIKLDKAEYHVEFSVVETPEEESVNDFTGEKIPGSKIIGVFLYDETTLNEAIRLKDEESLVTGLIYIDNFDEVLESVEEVRQAFLIATIDKLVSQYFNKVEGIAKKLERDRYFVLFKKKYFEQLKEDRFSLLDEVREIKMQHEIAPTLSIGIGVDGANYGKNYTYARIAIDMALGRGGDQVVIKSKDNMLYYGGKTQQVQSGTKVKARVKAEALREFLSVAGQVIIMGHKIADLDCFGSAMGIYRIAKSFGKKVHIVIDEVTVSVQPLLETFQNNPEYEEKLFITGEEAITYMDKNTMLVVVDTNRPSYTQCPKLLEMARTVVVLDHHRQMVESIKGAVLSYIEPYSSSASEMVAEILQYIRDDVKLKNTEANCLYAGIIIDTNNFTTKTGVRTFEAAAFLRRCGADIVRVRKMFRDDFASYQIKAETVRQAEVYRDCFAIARLPEKVTVQSPTILGSQAANELLNITGIKASFVLTRYLDKIFISARSIDEANVQLIMEKMGGGGHISTAGAQLATLDMDKAIQELKNNLDQMIEKGEIQ